MSQQAVGQAARRSALDAQAVLRTERVDGERRLEGLAVAVLTALGERDAAVQDADKLGEGQLFMARRFTRPTMQPSAGLTSDPSPTKGLTGPSNVEQGEGATGLGDRPLPPLPQLLSDYLAMRNEDPRANLRRCRLPTPRWRAPVLRSSRNSRR